MNYKYKVGIIMILVLITALVTSMLSSALLGQQHNWYNTSDSGNQVSCSKCHSNVNDEFEDMPSGAPHNSKACEYCHRNESGVTYAEGDGQGFQPGEEAHAASIPPCQQCHSPDTADLSSVNESHKPLDDTAGLNEACIMCHTGFDKSMKFTRALYIEYNITKVSGNWTVAGFDFVLSNSTFRNQTPSGSKHTWENASEIYCFDCHLDVKTALENGGHVPSSDNTSGEHGGKKAREGHKGRGHNFSRNSVTIDSCKPCHLPESSDFGSGYSHSEAQLDYHAATTEHCYNCHYNGTEDAPGCGGGGGGGGGGGECAPCHNILRSDVDHTDILYSMFSDPEFCWYKMDKVCVGCHMPGYPTDPVDFGNKSFTVYTEPSTTIDVTSL